MERKRIVPTSSWGIGADVGVGEGGIHGVATSPMTGHMNGVGVAVQTLIGIGVGVPLTNAAAVATATRKAAVAGLAGTAVAGSGVITIGTTQLKGMGV